MSQSTTNYAHGTSITQRFPWGTYVSADARCSDGKVRTTARISSTADTFYSVPASVKVNGKTVSGFITMDNGTVEFVATGKNADLLP